ncbi:MAG: NADP-dependent malic enzyme [Chromatiaceae bacterium]|nr:NADP-dependent malic enzyme [Chromatiaceae bacterium]
MPEESLRDQALRYHVEPVPGKLEIKATKPMATQRDLALAYSPGVAFACEEIAADENQAARLTARGNLVAVVTNGTAVLGLGNIGPLAAKPVMEGKAVLFKKFAGVDVFDIEINEKDPDKLIEIVAALEPTFGGINLEDIRAPECFFIEKALRQRMRIPVFHDDQHGTAIVAAAAVYNALRVVDKKIEDVVLTVSGAGAASLACIDLVVSMGLREENVYVCDRKGVIYRGRSEGMNAYKERFARETDKRTLDDAIEGADIFFGLSAPGLLSQEHVKKMAERPIILAMANPTPEIMPEEARAVRPDAILATGRSDYPNQVNNVLCFPFIFRGALDCGATEINEAMKIACVKAIADLATQESDAEVAKVYAGEKLKFGPDYLIPKPFDPRLIAAVPIAVVKAAMQTGVASRPIDDLEAYERKLKDHVIPSRVFMQPVIEMARIGQERMIFAEGENIDVLHAVQGAVDERIVRPILLGRPHVIQETIDALGLRIRPDKDFDLIDPEQEGQREDLLDAFHRIAGRRGVTREESEKRLRSNTTSLGAMLLLKDEAEGMICGKVGRFSSQLYHVKEVIGLHRNARYLSTLSTVLTEDEPIFLSDSFINVNPTLDQIVEKTKTSVEMVRRFGITPRVALLSHSNFGSSDAHAATKMRDAAALLREALPDLEIDGEMHSMSALHEAYRNAAYPYTRLSGDANLLIFPDLDSAAIALGLLLTRAKGLLVGPFLSGLAKPIHILVPSVTARGIFNMTALASADIVRYRVESQS